MHSHASWVIVKYIVALELGKHASKLEASRRAAAIKNNINVNSTAFNKGRITAENVKLPKGHKLQQYQTKGPGITERQKFSLDVTREVIERGVRNIGATIEKDGEAFDITPKRVGKAKRRRPATPSKPAAASVSAGAGAKRVKKSKVAPVVHKLVGLGQRGTGTKFGTSSRCNSCYNRMRAANELLLPANRAKAGELQRGMKRCVTGCHACQMYICTACVYTNGVHANCCPAVLKTGGLNPAYTCKECASLPCVC
jgi:hypothetical protein